MGGYTVSSFLSSTNLITVIINTIYPVGSLYTSFVNKNIKDLYGIGTWTQITDRFLYCSSSGGSTGGSKKITVSNLPSHNHGILSQYDDYSYNIEFVDTKNRTEMAIPDDLAGDAVKYTRTTYTNNTGSGTDYMPPYMTIFAWRRTA